MTFSTVNSTMPQKPTAIKSILKKDKRSINCFKRLFRNKTREAKPSVQFNETYEICWYQAALPIKSLLLSALAPNTEELPAASPKPADIHTKCKLAEGLEAVSIEELILAEVVQKNTLYNASIAHRWKI